MTTFCNREKCQGHLGKFNNCVAEALWVLALNGMHAGETGDAETAGHYSLMIIAKDTEIDISESNTDIVVIPAGFYLLLTVNSGAVHLLEHESEESARNEFDRVDSMYADGDDD